MRSPEELQQERIDEIRKEKYLRREVKRLQARVEALEREVLAATDTEYDHETRP